MLRCLCFRRRATSSAISKPKQNGTYLPSIWVWVAMWFKLSSMMMAVSLGGALSGKCRPVLQDLLSCHPSGQGGCLRKLDLADIKRSSTIWLWRAASSRNLKYLMDQEYKKGPPQAASVEKLRRGQFPMAVYVGLMESLARQTGVSRIPVPGLPENDGRGQGAVIASRYPSHNITEEGAEEVKKMLSSLAQMLGTTEADGSASPLPTPHPSLESLGPATFRALQGEWRLHRTLTSALPEYPSGTFKGTAFFHPREPTSSEYSAEMLYIEDGELTTLLGFVMRGRRRYVYRLKDGAGISSWFVKADGLTVDYLFHTLAFEADGREGWKANGTSHLCVEDYYEVDYRFYFSGIDIDKWELGYLVEGPKKDYSTSSTFRRPWPQLACAGILSKLFGWLEHLYPGYLA